MTTLKFKKYCLTLLVLFLSSFILYAETAPDENDTKYVKNTAWSVDVYNLAADARFQNLNINLEEMTAFLPWLGAGVDLQYRAPSSFEDYRVNFGIGPVFNITRRYLDLVYISAMPSWQINVRDKTEGFFYVKSEVGFHKILECGLLVGCYVNTIAMRDYFGINWGIRIGGAYADPIFKLEE